MPGAGPDTGLGLTALSSRPGCKSRVKCFTDGVPQVPEIFSFFFRVIATPSVVFKLTAPRSSGAQSISRPGALRSCFQMSQKSDRWVRRRLQVKCLKTLHAVVQSGHTSLRPYPGRTSLSVPYSCTSAAGLRFARGAPGGGAGALPSASLRTKSPAA